MSLRAEIDVMVKACTTGLWVVTSEPAEVERELIGLASDPKKDWNALFSWDAHRGVSQLKQKAEYQVPPGSTPTGTSPKGAIEMLAAFSKLGQDIDRNGCQVLTLHNYHKFLHLPDILQGLALMLQEGKHSRTFAIVLTPSLQIPPELKTYFTVLHHDLPNRQEIEQIVRELFPDETKGRAIPASLVDGASGLTRYEAENAFSISLAREGRLNARPVFEYKAQTLAKDGTLAIYKGTEGFESLGGLQSIKDFCVRALAPREGRKSVAKGVIALGVPGAGKSALAKALGHETNRPTVILDIANLLSKYVGESEGRLKQALSTLEAISPCVCMVDEIEKGLSGVGSGMDSGVMDRIFGTLLTWRQDTKADVFMICTSNNVSKMPAPLLRAGRTNAIFFFDLPTRKEKDLIWEMYRKYYELPEQSFSIDDNDWTGAEIKNACELADLLGITLNEAATLVVPISITSGDQITELRKWADGRVLSASFPGIYKRGLPGDSKEKAQRRRNLKPGNENLN